MDALTPVVLPKATFTATPSAADAAFDFQQLAQTLLQISIAGSGASERNGARRVDGSAVRAKQPHGPASSAPATAPPHAPQQPAQALPLPAGMQLLCSVAWDAVHSPGCVGGRSWKASEEKYAAVPAAPRPGATVTPSRHTAPPPFRSPNRFSTQFAASENEDGEEEDEDEGAWPSPSRALRRHSSEEEDSRAYEEQDTLNEAPERMHAHCSPAHASLVNLSRASQQQLQGVTWNLRSAFHDTSTFSTASQHQATPARAPRSTPFRVQQPADFALDEPDEDEADNAAASIDSSHQRALLPHAAAVAAATGAASAHAAPRNLDLEYEHLQQALHHLERNFSEHLASEVRLKIQELDVALALAVGIEPDDDALAPTASSALAQRSRLHAAQHKVSTLSARLSSAHARQLSSLQAEFLTLQQSHSAMVDSLRAKLSASESKIASVLAHNHTAVTKLRDEAVRAQQQEKQRAEEAAEAERKKAEEEKAKLAKEMAEKAEAEKKAAAEELAAKAAADKAKAEASAKEAADKAAAAAATAATVTKPVAAAPAAAVGAPSAAAAQEMAQRTAKLQTCRASCAAFAANPAAKQRKMQITMHINRQVAQVVGTVSQVQAKAQALLSLLRQSQASSAEEYAFCLDTIASKLVSFTKSKVRLQNSAAFPLAMVALYIALEHGAFTDVLLASLAEKCTYIAPQYLERKNYPSMHAYMLALGYEEQAPEEGQAAAAPTVDGEEQYFERMVGYVCMYAAFVEKDAANHPHGIEHGWIWLARVLNQKPRSATAAILHAFLNTAGHALFTRYPTQMRKLLTFLNTDYLLRLDASTPPRKAAQAVLALWLQTTLHQIGQYGRFAEPEGKIMPTAQDSDTSEQQVYHDDV